MSAFVGAGDAGYSLKMSVERLRRLCAFIVALALIVGLGAHGAAGAEMNVKMLPSAATDMPMPSDCNGCGDSDEAMPGTACVALCGAFVAVLPVAEVVMAKPTDRRAPALTPGRVGLHGPPDPYPPRPVILS